LFFIIYWNQYYFIGIRQKSNSCYDCAWIGGDWCEQERKQVEIPKKAKYNKNTEKQRREVFE